MKVYVKTVYGAEHHREPNISEYDNQEEAEMMVKTTLQYGIDIVSCEIVPEDTNA